MIFWWLIMGDAIEDREDSYWGLQMAYMYLCAMK